VGDPSAAPFSTALAKISGICNEKEEVHFWPSNYCRSLVLTIERENQESLAIELLKPFKFGHPAVLQSSFADVAATWRWAHISAPCLLPLLSSSSSLSSPLSSAGVHHSIPPRLPATAELELARSAALTHGGALSHSPGDVARGGSSSSRPGLRKSSSPSLGVAGAGKRGEGGG
jgi:hypothetical protein